MKRYRQIAETVGWAGLISFTSLAAAWTALGFLLVHNFKLATVFACAAFLLDATDGFIARKLGKASEFGRQLDSMIDAMNYSLFAGVFVSQVVLPGTLGFIAGYTILAFGILRLVLFNIGGYHASGDNLYYTGVVTPHLSLASLIVYSLQHLTGWLSWEGSEWLVFAVLMALALGQISTLKVRKTGALAFWIPATVVIGVCGFIWL